MARHYEAPKCKAPDEMGGNPDRPCGTKMRMVEERHPLWRLGHFIFVCPRCEGVQAFDAATIDRYARPR